MCLESHNVYENHSISVPCLRRAISVEEEYNAAGAEVLLDNDENDGWLATHGKPKGSMLFSRVITYDVLYWSGLL